MPGGSPITTAETIAAVHDGFRDSHPADVERVREWIQAVVRGGNWRFADAEGVVQDVLLELLQTVRRGKVRDPGGFQKFVYTVAKNTCVTRYHRERRRRDHEDSAADADRLPGGSAPDRSVEESERLELMAAIFQRLPGSCRKLWAWVYGEGLSAGEIGERLGITANNVRVRVHRCLEKARGIGDELLDAGRARAPA